MLDFKVPVNIRPGLRLPRDAAKVTISRLDSPAACTVASFTSGLRGAALSANWG